MFQVSSFKSQQGVALYLAIVILSLMTATLLGFMSILISQTKIMANLSNSVIAFYAADTGIEEMLFKIYKEDWLAADGVGRSTNDCIIPGGACNCPGVTGNPNDWVGNVVDGEPGYQVCVSSGDTEVIWATGDYRGTTRKIEIDFN